MLARFDSSACFANLLGTKENGRWLITPVDPGAKISRSIAPYFDLSETTIETAMGSPS